MAARRISSPATREAPVSEPEFDLLAMRRVICAGLVRNVPTPRHWRIHSHLSLGPIAKVIRAEMTKDGAPDSKVDEYVAKYVQRV